MLLVRGHGKCPSKVNKAPKNCPDGIFPHALRIDADMYAIPHLLLRQVFELLWLMSEGPRAKHIIRVQRQGVHPMTVAFEFAPEMCRFVH